MLDLYRRLVVLESGSLPAVKVSRRLGHSAVSGSFCWKRLKADVIAGPAWMLKRRALPAATSATGAGA
jgi:hypothetical protein